MPLLHQDNSRGGGGSNENRRSLAELLGLDASQMPDPPTGSAVGPLPNFGQEPGPRTWRWEEPRSPEAAHTPRALVPPACFPPRHPRAFASYSESAQPGSGWPEESTSGHGITDLMASLKALAMPAPSASSASMYASMPPPARLSYDQLEKAMEPQWAPEQASGASSRPNRGSLLPRRASFCGAMSSSGPRPEVLVWSGALPPRSADPAGGYSAKVFLGGLPWDITEHTLMHTLRHFHPVRVEWPGRESGGGGAGGASPRGYAYVTLESERRVRALLAASRCDGRDWYYRIASRKMRTKEVQVIPWAVCDSNWVSGGSARLEPARTVFVGALHGMISAAGLATIMNDLFSGVVYAGIDTDKNKYPIGSGRVTFNNVRSYVRAISAAYIEIRTAKFTKKVQVDPYLEDSMCSVCNLQQGPYFCREPSCFGYFCRSCWSWQHSAENHKPLMRSSKSVQSSSTNGHGASRPALSPPTDRAPALCLNGGNGAYTATKDGTPSPATSGASGASGTSGGASSSEQGGGEEAGWPPR